MQKFEFWDKIFNGFKTNLPISSLDLIFHSQTFSASKDILFYQTLNPKIIKIIALSPCLFHIQEPSLEKPLKIEFWD